MSKYFKITVCPLFQIEGNLIYFEFVCFFPKKESNWQTDLNAKRHSPEKTQTNYVFTFQFFNDKFFNFTIKSHLALGNLPKLLFWSILSFQN